MGREMLVINEGEKKCNHNWNYAKTILGGDHRVKNKFLAFHYWLVMYCNKCCRVIEFKLDEEIKK